jgi:hypothetical protein
MKHSDRANQIAPPFDQLEHMPGICGVNIRMPQIFDRSAIARFSNGENLKPQLTKTHKPPPRIHRNFMPPPQNQPAKFRINLRNQRALMSSIRSIKRRHRSRIATLPRRFPSLNASTGRHGPKLTRSDEEGKWIRTIVANGTSPFLCIDGKSETHCGFRD